MIAKHRDKLVKLSKELLKKETLNLNEIIEILGERPFPPTGEFAAYLKSIPKQDVKGDDEEPKEKKKMSDGEGSEEERRVIYLEEEEE